MKFVFTAVSASLLATATFAGGYAEPIAEPPLAPTLAYATGTDWSGFYVGLQYGTGNLNLTDGVDTVDVGDFDAYGVHAGYMWDLGRIIVGAELDYNKVALDDDIDLDGDLKRFRGRIGADLGRFMPYASLGFASLSSDGESESGTTYGIGADYLATDSFSVGLEYSAHDFDDIDGSGISANADLVQIRASFRF